MNNNLFESKSMKVEAGVSIVDLERLTESIWVDLHGAEDPRRIRHVLEDLLLKYKDAHIPTFLTILLRREAIEILRQ
jgi:hypothetical protein